MKSGGVSLPAPPRPRSGGAQRGLEGFTGISVRATGAGRGMEVGEYDPGDYSGHRLLADSYSILQRHEIARV